MKKYFFDEWKNKSDTEKRAIDSFRKGLELILHAVPKDEIVSVYVKGSFPMREMNDKSDVDFVTVLKTTKYASLLRALHQKYHNKISPEVQLNPCYSLWELKTGKKRKICPPNQHPGSFVSHLDSLELVYGERINKTDFKERSPEKEVAVMARTILEQFIPNIEKKLNGDQSYDNRIGFSSVLKAVLWLSEAELRANQVHFRFSYKGINDSIKDSNHIAHDAYRLRIHPTNDEAKRREFIEKLKKHVKEDLRRYGK